jgi:TolB-like protein/Flp pilus assembly protein TadD
MIAAAIALLVLIAASIAWLAVDRRAGPTRIAVLPFENLTGDDDLAYLASGLAEETSTSLGQIDVKDLRVIRVSAQGFAESSLSLGEFARKYGVDFVVQSSLRLDRQRIRVTSRLVRIADNEQVWSASIDRELTNVLGVQRELSTAIAEQVRLRLSPEFAAAIARRQTQNPAAYSLYLKARYEWSKLTPAATRRALDYFDQATKADPNYALAWAGLAFGAITSTRTADMAPMTAIPIARHALDEALRLGPDLAETQYAKGYLSLFHELDRPAAEKAGRAAIKLDPNNAQAHVLLGVSLMRAGNAVEGREMMRRARELEPMFALAFANSANVALSAGDLQGALEFSRQTIAIDPEFWLGHYYLGRVQIALGDLNAALRAISDAARFSDGHSMTYTTRVDLLLRLGRRDEARELLEEAEERATRQYMPPYSLAVLQALFGNKDAALDRLNRAIEVHDVNLLGFETDARLRSLHDDPRYTELVQRCDCSFDTDAKR